MKSIKVELPSTLEYVNLYCFSDWHIGDKHCKIDEIKEEIETARKDPNGYVVMNGDLCDTATKASVSFEYGTPFTPGEEINLVTDLLMPIKDKILMITMGNHEARVLRESGVDTTSIVANNLGILDRYVREGGVLFLGFGKTHRTNEKGGEHRLQRYSIYATHGSGGGRKEGGKTIRLADMQNIVDCDVYLHSHTHLPVALKEAYFRVDTRTFSVYMVDKLFVNTSAKLDYGGYGQTFEFKPASTASPVIRLDGHKRGMKVLL